MRYSSKPLLHTVMLLCAVATSAIGARAQFIGYTSPQSVQQILASNTPCTGASQNFTVQNLGQTQHYAYLVPTSVTKLNAHIEGVDAAGQSYTISDQMFSPNSGSLPLVMTGSGYFPIIRVVVQCSTGLFTLNYSGSSATGNVNTGAYMMAQSNKTIFALLPAGADQFSPNNLQPPFLNTAGKIRFAWASAPGPAGSSISIYCGSPFSAPGPVTYELAATFPINATLVDIQEFNVPPANCPFMEVVYTHGAASVTNFEMDYTFAQPSFVNNTLGSYSHITGTTATPVKTFGGTLTQITVGTAAAGTITLTDLDDSACTATPATNIVSVLTIQANANPVTIPLNVVFGNGICVKASVAMDLTVGFQ